LVPERELGIDRAGLTQKRPWRNAVKLSRKRDESERLAEATVSARLQGQHVQKQHGAETGDFIAVPEIWLDRIRLGFPRANSW
jgi:hypothetical protein